MPRFVLAKSAIRCRFVDRFAGSRVPSLVSCQRFSPRDVSLPSLGSRRARFPDVTGTMKTLRLPACVCLFPYGFGPRFPVRLLSGSCSPKRSRRVRRSRSGPGTMVQPVSLAGVFRAGTRAGSLRLPGDPSRAFALLQDPGRVDKSSPLAGLPMLPPAQPNRRPQREEISRGLPHGFSTCRLRFTSRVTAAHARLASGWRAAPLPGGCRTLWIAVKGFGLHPSPFPGLCPTQG